MNTRKKRLAGLATPVICLSLLIFLLLLLPGYMEKRQQADPEGPIRFDRMADIVHV